MEPIGLMSNEEAAQWESLMKRIWDDAFYTWDNDTSGISSLLLRI